MPDPIGWGQTAQPNSTQANTAAPATPEVASVSKVPPPTLDVQVRTMRTDLDTLHATGGNAMFAAHVQVQAQPTTQPSGYHQGLSVPEDVHPFSVGPVTIPEKTFAPTQQGTHTGMAGKILVSFVLLIVSGSLLLGGYALYSYLTAQRAVPVTPEPVLVNPTTTEAVVVPSQSENQFAPEEPADIPRVDAHASFLLKPVDERITLRLPDRTGEIPVLKTHYQVLQETLARAQKTSQVIEVVAQDASGNPISFPGYLASIGAPIVSTRTYVNNFVPDFTILGARENGQWQGAYILKLQEGKNWLFAQEDVAGLEKATGLETIFFQIPGRRIGVFVDTTVANLEVRAQNYTEPSGTFVYGWFRDQLILATSPKAFSEAVTRLQLN